MTISSVASDTNDPLRVPFTIQNNSHIFSIKNLSWICGVENVETDAHSGIIGIGFKPEEGKFEKINPGATVNIDCNVVGPTSGLAHLAGKITEAVIAIDVEYDADIFGYKWHREPEATQFSWYGGTTFTQWIKGPLLGKK